MSAETENNFSEDNASNSLEDIPKGSTSIQDEEKNEEEVNTSTSENLRKRKIEDDVDDNSKSNKYFKPDKHANDNNSPSDLSTSNSKNNENDEQPDKHVDHTNLVANHYNNLEEKGFFKRNESRIIYLRNFNNWIKSMLIIEYMNKNKQKKSHGDPLRVLDMCCGKGGDLFKWKKGEVTHLICADIAEVSVQQCKSRYNGLNHSKYSPLFSAEFLAYDCTKVRLREKYKDVTMQLDLVSCQFAFHYSFESLPQAECMFKNASETLKPGGYFIGTIPYANELVARWQKADYKPFGNEVYSIDFQCDKDNIPLFGAKYNFHLEGVVDCPEFLVHIPTFCKLASKFGLELIAIERFSDFFKRSLEDGKFLLSKMQALETYPPYHEAPLVSENLQEYNHAVDYMQNSTGHRKIGTLTKSEWEATTLYCVFAFQKAKTVWNAEGKPEFVKL